MNRQFNRESWMATNRKRVKGNNGDVKYEEKVIRIPGYPLRKTINGIYVLGICPTKLILRAMKFKPEAGDIMIVTGQKCGTSWLQEIVYALLHDGEMIENPENVDKEIKMLVRSVHQIEMTPAPRVIKTHFATTVLKYSTHAKYIVGVRNPLDVVISNFHHTIRDSRYQFQNGTLKNFFEVWIKGEIEYGDYFEFIKSWLPYIHQPNVLLCIYERLHSDRCAEIARIAEFVGGDAQNLVLKNPDVIPYIAEQTQIEQVWKRSVQANQKGKANWLREKNSHFRSGIVGDGERSLSAEQVYTVKNKFTKVLGSTEAAYWWPELLL